MANNFFFLIFHRTIISENNRIELFYNIQKVIEMILGRDVYYYSVNKNRNMGTRNLHIHVPRSRSTRLYSFFFFFSLFYSTLQAVELDMNLTDTHQMPGTTMNQPACRYICFGFAY